MPIAADRRLAGTFNFVISLSRSGAAESGAAGVRDMRPPPPGDESLGDGGFQECSGLEIEMDVQELQEGGRNDGVIRRVGHGKYSNLVLKRGMLYGEDNRVNTEIWRWLQGILQGVRPVPRYDGMVQVLAGDHETVLATWVFDRGLPAKVAGPQLNASTGDIAIEELHISHEGLRLVT
jgi:phage tail-like protein